MTEIAGGRTSGPAPRRHRPSTLTWMRTARRRSLLTVPLIYSLALPLLLLDAWVTLYQRSCFPVFGIRPVARRRYFVFDRHHLRYLNWIERLHCSYCSYATGVLAYTREVTSRTEAYWCPIRHRHAAPSDHARTPAFFGYGDAAGYQSGLIPLRRTLRRRDRARQARAAA